jgi:hypothetical protein
LLVDVFCAAFRMMFFAASSEMFLPSTVLPAIVISPVVAVMLTFPPAASALPTAIVVSVVFDFA